MGNSGDLDIISPTIGFKVDKISFNTLKAVAVIIAIILMIFALVCLPIITHRFKVLNNILTEMLDNKLDKKEQDEQNKVN